MRQVRTAQISIFENYVEHEIADQLKRLSDAIDLQPSLLSLIEADLVDKKTKNTGRCGLTVESVFRSLLLKQQLQVSYEQLAFHLADSTTYRTFVRLDGISPKKSSLQAALRSVRPETLEKVNQLLIKTWLDNREISCKELRVDSTVVKSNIAPPSDSQLLNDGVRVLSRHLAKSREKTGVKIRFVDQRKASKSLAFRIFNAKKDEKHTLYPELLKLTRIVLRQVDRALEKIGTEEDQNESMVKWVGAVKHYRDLTLKVIDQTERRVINDEKVPSSQKIVSIFEEHTDIIVKGFRDIQYGHKINVCSNNGGFITHLSIEEGNTADSALFLPVLKSHKEEYKKTPTSIVCDGCYASQQNVKDGRDMGVKHVAFNKKVGLTYRDMGLKKKTFDKLKNFRAGIEGNISELKRAFGASKAKWKGHDGFQAFVWSSVLAYNLVRMARLKKE